MVVCNVPDYGTEEVADHAIMFLLALVRRLVVSHQAIRDGNWDYRTALGAPRLRGKTFGIVGCGRIGTAAAHRAKALGLDVVFYDPYLRQGMDKALGIRRVYTLDELLEQSHFVSLHCYLDATSRAPDQCPDDRPDATWCDPDQHGPWPDHRGDRVARRPGQRPLAAAGLDVDRARALDYDRLRNHPKVLLTPHTAFYSVEGYNELRNQDRRGNPAHPAGRAATKPGEFGGIKDHGPKLGSNQSRLSLRATAL